MTVQELLAVLLERREATKAARHEAGVANRRVTEAARLEKEAFDEWLDAFQAAQPNNT